MFEFLTFLLCACLVYRHWREPEHEPTLVPNMNPEVDEWNARALAEEESESFNE